MRRSEILDTAKKYTCEDRNMQYGTPEDNFGRIAELWSVYKEEEFLPRDVAFMMILVKVARAMNGDSLDNFVDIAGYAACGGELVSEQPGMRMQEEIRKREDDAEWD